MLYKSIIDKQNAINVAQVYIIKIALLSKCKHLVGGKVNGTRMAMIMNNGKYETIHVFEKGYY